MRKKIEDYERVTARFHMPGHSGARIDDGLYSIGPYDITELDWSDNLAHPQGDIKTLEERIARVYGAGRAFVLTEGATAGIQVALLVAREARGVIYLLGETHKSCISYASIIGLEVNVLDSVDEAVLRAREGACIYVTSPNYYGDIIDITPILEARANGSIVIVDEAHGAHYVFSELLPESVAGKADFAVESMHKTLPVFTGGALLCVNNSDYTAMAEYFKCKIHSTSPSYLIMQSIESAIDIMSERGSEMYRTVWRDVRVFKDMLDTRYRVKDTADFTRVVIECNGAEDVALYLERHDVYIELFDDSRLVLIVTPFNSGELTLVAELLREYDGEDREDDIDNESIASTPTFCLERARGTRGTLAFLPLDRAVGYVSMSEIAVYPPGVPVVRTGDVLTREVLEYIGENRDRIVGLVGDTIAVRELCEEN